MWDQVLIFNAVQARDLNEQKLADYQLQLDWEKSSSTRVGMLLESAQLADSFYNMFYLVVSSRI